MIKNYKSDLNNISSECLSTLTLLSFNKITVDQNTIVHFKGVPFYEEKLVDLSAEKSSFFWNKLSNLSAENIEEFSLKMQGSFAFVIETKDRIILLSDYIRTFPMFYSVSEKKILLSDKLNLFSEYKIKSDNVSNLVTSGYVFGNETIYDNVNSTQAAELIIIDKDSATIEACRYFRFVPKDNLSSISVDSFVNEYNKILERIMKRIILSAPNCNKWVIPLSGGHDSRQLINILVKLGIKNVICYTYGKLNNHQAVLSKKVADAVGYDWHFVEYSEEKWFELHQNGLIDTYLDDSYQGNSIPHFQDFLAVYELKNKGVITEDDVIMPGHTLDMISGGHLNELDLVCSDRQGALKRSSLRHGKCKELSVNKLYANYRTLSTIYDEINSSAVQFQEYINWQERQSKFIVNSCRIYEFFEIEFRLPFWEKEIMELFLSLPVEQRIERKFYLSTERQGILIDCLAKIPFEDETNKKPSKISLKQRLLTKTPSIVKALLSRLVRSKNYEAESLNQIFALKGNTVEDVVGSLKLFPKDTHAFLKPLLLRYTHRTSNELLTGLYAVSRIIKK
ncbi:asparagine synthase C-terminal domain-containing protein [Flavobacterium ardleyense]|uniref:asparagine synthase C-terminal domain-containing protein n=1 Tax=Flavobacterium ardleyense TaxID=2038737 RepID=UPI00298C88F2|nr:asparagine synthase C-terminal domain-containing protein [Flavobacterium ardleyense]